MIVEIAVALGFVLLGAPLAALGGLTRWGLAAFAPLLGALAFMSVGAVQVVLYLPTYPAITLVLAAVLALVVGISRRRQLAASAVPIGVAAAVAVIIAGGAHALALVKWSADSMVYLAIGGLLASNRYHMIPAPEVAMERLIGVGLLHAPAHADGGIALLGVTPLVAASALAVSIWVTLTGARGRAPSRQLAMAIGLLVALTVAANRMAFTAFYINGHVIVGAAVLVIVGSAWLVACDRAPRGLLWACAVAIPASVVTRPDAAALLAVVLVGVVAEPRVAPRDRALLVGTLGVSTAAWNSYLASVFHAAGDRVPREVLAQILGGVALVVVAAVLRRPVSAPAGVRIVTWAGIVIGTATAAAVAARPSVAGHSVYATVVNLAYHGGWAPFLPLLMAALAAALILFSLPEARALQWAVLTFPAVALLLATARDGAYRVGPGDSLNRSWAHIVPAALLLLVITVLLGRLRRVPATPPDAG